MPHTPESRIRAYDKMKRLRREWLQANGPCSCGSWDRLEVDHVDPSKKVHHAVWTWRQERREEELKKCQALCYGCHKKKTAAENSTRRKGIPNEAYRRLSKDAVKKIRVLMDAGFTERSVAKLFGVSKATVHDIKIRKRYADVNDHIKTRARLQHRIGDRQSQVPATSV